MSNQCHICSLTFAKESDLAFHLRSMHPKNSYKCGICNTSFSSDGELKLHIEMAHTIGGLGVAMKELKTGHYCAICGDKFPLAIDLDRHIASAHNITSDKVNHPPHYKSHPSGVECITITEHFNFNRGNAIKYIWRAGEKGNEVEDLKKAAWYINREIMRLEEGQK